ncbi:MAG: hypothetical protein AB1633_03370 [Elusimicrobiota bacterium]
MKIKLFIISVVLIIFYLLITFWRISFAPIHAHSDGLWYLKVAENIVKGRGLVEDVVWHFYPRIPVLAKFPHPVGTYWNPLDSIIISGFYKTFGISVPSGRLPALLMDAFIVVFIIWFFSKVFPDNIWIPSLSALIYIIHPMPLDMRALSGVPETFDIFFITLSFFFTYKAVTSNKFYGIPAGVFSGLAYMSRNEGLWTFFSIICVFFYLRLIYRRDLSLKIPMYAVAAFILTILPLEIRNYAVFGSHAYGMKKHLLRITEFWDISVFDFENKLGTIYGSILSNFILRKFSSFYYKAEIILDLVAWPLIALIPLGIIKNRDKLEFLPAGFFILISYVATSWLFSAAQRSGFHAPGSILPFLTVLGVSGAFYFSSQIIRNERFAKLLGIGIVLALFSYFISMDVKTWKEIKKSAGENVHVTSSKIILDWFTQNKQEDAVIMIHMPPTFNYFTNLKFVQIPTNDPISSINNAAKYYNADYLVLTSNIPSIFEPLYAGRQKVPGLRLVFRKDLPFNVPIIGGGNKIEIYKIDRKEIK